MQATLARVIPAVRLRLQTLAIRHVDPHFDRRHPGRKMLRALRALAPAIRLLQPNDRWNLPAFVPAWAAAAAAPPRLPQLPARRIVMFGCYRGQFTRDLVLACLLAWRGHSVTYCYLPKLRSPIKPPLADSPGAKDYLDAALAPVERLSGGRIRCREISGYADGVATVDEAYLAVQTRADVVMCVRQEHFDPNDPETASALAYYTETGRLAQRAATGFLRAHSGEFDLALVANGASFESGHFCAAAAACGLTVNTIEKFAFARALVVNHGGPFYHFADLDRAWTHRHEIGFGTGTGRARLAAAGWELLDQRRGTRGGAWGWQYQKAKPRRTQAELEALLGQRAGGFVLVCPNVPFDAGYESWLTVFPSMRTWLVETIRALLAAGERVVVRAHPAEARPGYGREPISTILSESALSDPRLVVLPGDSDVNTYDLMPICRFACVFASTSGIEIAMHGRQVLAGAGVYYSRLGITVPASDRAGYFAALDDLVRDRRIPGPSLADDAACIYALFHYLLQWPYPYDKPSHVSAMPPARLFADGAYPGMPVAEYVETLDTLAMTATEFEAALPRLARFERLAARWSLPLDEPSPAREAHLSA